MTLLQKILVKNVKQLYLFLLAYTQIQEIFFGKQVKRILDVGIGNGVTAGLLKEMTGKHIEGLDINNDLWSAYQQIPLTVYNGRIFPFPKNNFDLILIFLVLHHCDDPLLLLKEAERVTTRYVLVLEELRTNVLMNLAMVLYDWFINFLIYGHGIQPAHFVTEEELERLFTHAKLEVKLKVAYKKYGWLSRVAYLLEKKSIVNRRDR